MHGARLHKTSRRDAMARDPRRDLLGRDRDILLRDRDETLVSRDRLETETSLPRPHPCRIQQQHKVKLSDRIISDADVVTDTVRLSVGCGRQSRHQRSGPVCDTNNKEFASICQLLRRRRTLAYHGHCRVEYHPYGLLILRDF